MLYRIIDDFHSYLLIRIAHDTVGMRKASTHLPTNNVFLNIIPGSRAHQLAVSTTILNRVIDAYPVDECPT